MKLAVMKRAVTKLAVTKLAVTKLAVTKLAVTKLAVTKLAVTKLIVTKRAVIKLIAAASALAALLLSSLPLASPAAAAADPGAPTPADVEAARTAAAGATETVGRFFAGKGQQSKTRLAPMAAQVNGPTVAVNDLNPDFIAGRSPEIARFAFLATQASAADGQTASVWTTRTPAGTWAVSNIASGADEQQYAGQPGVVFREPQLNAWYALRGGQVVPLNTEATQSIGAAGVPMADYQRLVRQRYGAKLPGSAYARDGYAGGYGSGNSSGNSSDYGGYGGFPTTDNSSGPLPWVAGAGVLAAALIAILLLRRRTT
ncbi:hypothetical protein HII36_27980 [Nonomuraea sp. NN258]|uniref:hypothetical protein n=1 Tax=Nonomuraea antri TaxID=2730852 RepID=UPI00156823DE|nr:hypothetical protein [Nonomuraea antri]NRQ35645.1 hypothetical protein [Nonomuraea antri]